MRFGYKIIFLFFAAIVFTALISIANASVSGKGMVLTKTSYAPQEMIEGLINLSLSKEPANSLVSALEQNITVLDFLQRNGLGAEKDFYCNPADCQEYYATKGGSVKQKSLTGKSMIGVMIIGKDIEIKSNPLEFSIQGNGGNALCGASPLQIDLLSDNKIDWIYTEPSDVCGALHPSDCYDDAASIKDFDVMTTAYCQKIFLPLAGKFKIAALVKKNKDGGDLTVFIYNKKNGDQAECDLPEPNVTAYVEENCFVDLNVFDDTQDYYVCIKDNVMDNAYTIKSEISEPKCGYSGIQNLAKNASADFALLVQQTAIQPLNKTVKFNEGEFSKFNSRDIGQYIQQYTQNKYGNDCTKGCIVPIAITSSDITLNDLSLSYCAQGLCTTERNFFELEREYPAIDMNTTQLSLNVANFSVDGYGIQKVQLFVGTEKIGEQEISIEKVPVIRNLIAINAQGGTEATFFAEAYSPKNNSIMNYEWNFGDGSRQTTNINSVNHTYSNVGKFNVVVSATDSEGLKGSRTFPVMIGSPKEILNVTLKEKRTILDIIKKEIDSSGWYKPLLEKQLKPLESESLLDEYKNEYRLATSDGEYVSLILKVEKLNLVKELYDSEFNANVPVVIDIDAIQPELVEGLNGGIYDATMATETKNAIWGWQYENIAMTANSRVIGATDEDNKKTDVATIITLKARPINPPLKEAYIVILAQYDGAIFAAEYGQRKTVDNIGFVLNNLAEEQSISFALPGKVDIIYLNVFASPHLSELEISEKIICNDNRICEKELGENWKNCREDCKPTGLAVIFVAIILIVMCSLYLILQKWYKTKYEKYLFKPEDLPNLMAFVTNSLRKDDEKSIREKLKKAGWSSEQISYVFQKIKGKKIGMPEIFKFKLPKHRKV